MFNKIQILFSCLNHCTLLWHPYKYPYKILSQKETHLPYQDKKEKHKFVGNNIERETNYTVWLQIIYLANR